jgi:hypothetical protein
VVIIVYRMLSSPSLIHDAQVTNTKTATLVAFPEHLVDGIIRTLHGTGCIPSRYLPKSVGTSSPASCVDGVVKHSSLES